ncbi:MAG: ABC transporter substrate-binding protein [Burkholderiaceae bacterium]
MLQRMIKRSKRAGTVAAGVAATAAVVALAAPTVAWAQIRIGFIAELSGPQGPLGQDQYDALMMVVERNGGKLGGQPVTVIREDSQLKPPVAVQLVDKLIDKDRVQIITGVTFSNIMMAIHKQVTDKKVFLIGSNAGPSPIAGAQCSQYFFSTSWENGQQAEVMGKFAADKGYKKVVAIAPNYQAGKDFVAGFSRLYVKPTALELWPNLNTQDFSTELAQIQATRPDAIFTFLPGGLGINFIKQFNQAGLTGKIPLLTASTTDGIGLPAMGDAALGVLAGTFWGPDTKGEANAKFVKDFEDKYKRIPSQYAAQSYEAALLLDSAIRKVNGKLDDHEAFRKALQAADFDSIRGKKLKFNNNQFPIQDLHAFEVVKDAKGRNTLKTIATPMVDAQDAFHEKCSLK